MSEEHNPIECLVGVAIKDAKARLDLVRAAALFLEIHEGGKQAADLSSRITGFGKKVIEFLQKEGADGGEIFLILSSLTSLLIPAIHVHDDEDTSNCHPPIEDLH